MDTQHILVPAEPLTPAEPIQDALEREIVRRTWGQVHRLRVDVIDDCVVITGFARSYHAKQLALHAVLDTLEATDSNPRFELAVDVGPGGR